jgi:tripartite-type tricarboxylate transporter receptor subunit TctC
MTVSVILANAGIHVEAENDPDFHKDIDTGGHRVKLFAAILCAALIIATAHAQTGTFPSKPLRVIVPYPPGGGSDTIVRPLAQRLSENLRQQVVIDNRGGASGNIGMELAAKAPADGHTLVFALTAQLAVNPALFRKIPYDPIKDFEPITLLASGPYVLVVHPSLPVKSLRELIALARAKPGQVVYASSGNGSGGHLANELLNTMAGVKMLHVPYKGGGPALVDLLAGNVQVLFATWASGRPHIESGRIRALAVSTAKRLSGVDLPTVAEAGLPGYDAGVWYAFLGPAGTPKDVISKLNAEILRVLTHPEYKALLAKAAIEPIGSTPEELARYLKSELVKWAKVVKDANVQVD